jgi:hypothetical protein
MRSLALLAALFVTGACAVNGAVSEEAGPVTFRTVANATYATNTEATAVAAFDAETYRAKWESLIGNGEPPAVDFATESVVFLFGGQRPTGGYKYEVRGVSIDGDTLVVDGGVKGPPSRSINTMALTSPYAVIAVNSRAFKDVRVTP